MNHARILVVEDKAVVAMEIEERLVAMGHQLVGTVSSGEKALQCIRDRHPDLVMHRLQPKS